LVASAKRTFSISALGETGFLMPCPNQPLWPSALFLKKARKDRFLICLRNVRPFVSSVWTWQTKRGRRRRTADRRCPLAWRILRAARGIRPAIESGLLAAKAILGPRGGASRPTLFRNISLPARASDSEKVQEEWAFQHWLSSSNAAC